MQGVAVDTTGFALKNYIYMHRAIRNDIANLAATSRRFSRIGREDATKLQKWFAFFWDMVEVHHTTEDDQFFPAILERVPAIENEAAVLTQDHEELHALVEEIGATLGRLQQQEQDAEREKSTRHLTYLTDRFEKEMSDHLSREEEAVIPTLVRYFSPEEQLAMEKGFKHPPLKHMALLVPWIASALTAEEEAVALKSLPLPMRVLYKLSWKKKYEKFTAVFRV
jgi:hemerythrin-like domain-containing protein